MKTIILCAALPLEVSPIAKKIQAHPPTANTPIQGPFIYKNNAYYLIASGIGASNMTKLLQKLTAEHVDLWVSIGFAGALVEQLHKGDCLWGHHFISEQGDSSLFDYALNHNDGYEHRPLLCASKMLTSKQSKQAQHEKTGAVLVDMESIAVAEHAQQRGENCIWIRIVSDTLAQTMPENLEECMNAQGYPSTSRFTKRLFSSHPKEMIQLIQMGWDAQKLNQRLANFTLEKFV